MAVVEGLNKDLLQRLRVCKHVWAQRFESGLQAPHDNYDFGMSLRTVVQSISSGYWVDLFSERRQQEKEQRELIERSGQAYIPGIPDELVKQHIWPQVAKYFRDISVAQHAEEEKIVLTLYSIHLLNKQWKHLADFSYEWSVYRMVRSDFNNGWVWYSYNPTLKGPLTELSRMMDLLPDPFVPDVFTELHKSMGVLPTDWLWIWHAFLNTSKHLHYHGELHCGRDYDGYFHGKDPCYDCIFYPRLHNSTFGNRVTHLRFGYQRGMHRQM